MKPASSPNWQEYDRAGKVVARRSYDRAGKIFADTAEDAGLKVERATGRGGVTGKRITQVIVDDPSAPPEHFDCPKSCVAALQPPELFPLGVILSKPPRPRRAK